LRRHHRVGAVPAGAHLVALLATTPSIASGIAATPWLGTVSLDSAALDVVRIMESKHFPLFDRAFGRAAEYWKSASPFHALAGAGRRFLAVCSTRRNDSCPAARAFVAKAFALGMRASVLEQGLSHRDLNQRLGEDRGYTEAVEAFLGSLDESIARALANRSGGLSPSGAR
jgi:arylformamidase